MDYKTIFKNISTGTKARQESGFAPAFIDSSLEISQKFGTGLSFRDGNPPIRFGQFKPMKLKTKTASMGVVPMMTARKIVVDRDLHRFGSKPVPLEYSEQSENPKNRPSHNKGSLKLLFADPNIVITEINERGELFYRMKNVVEEECLNPDAAKNTRYMIKLTDPMDPPKLSGDELEALKNTFRSNLESAEIPEGLYPVLKKFGALDLNKEYYTYYQKERGQPYKPEMVVGDPPFSGDADMFSVSIPLHLSKTPLHKSHFIKSPKDIKKFFQKLEQIREVIQPRLEQDDLVEITEKILNKSEKKQPFTYDRKQFSKLSNFEKLNMPSKEVLKIIEDLEVFLSTENLSGLATQYEFIVGAAINRVASNSVVGDMIKNMILHGPETNNPNKPSSLDYKILHFFDGQVYMTHNEQELVAFYMETSYLEKNFQPVHPSWNMDLWHDVISKQIALGQSDLIKPKTLLEYIKHAQENNLSMPDMKLKNKNTFIKALHRLEMIDKAGIVHDYMLDNNLKFSSRKSVFVKQMSQKFELPKQQTPLPKQKSTRMSKKIRNMMSIFNPSKKISTVKSQSTPRVKSQSRPKVISKDEFLNSLQNKDGDDVVQSIIDYIKNIQDEYIKKSKDKSPRREARLNIIKKTNLLVNKILDEREDLTPKDKVIKIKSLLSLQKAEIQKLGQQVNGSSGSIGIKSMHEILIADQKFLQTYDSIISSVNEAYDQQFLFRNLKITNPSHFFGDKKILSC